MTLPNYKLIKKHITPKILDYPNGYDLLLTLTIPVNGSITLSAENQMLEPCLIELQDIVIQLEVDDLPIDTNSFVILTLQYTYDSRRWSNADVISHSMIYSELTSTISEALLTAGFSKRASEDLLQINFGFYGEMVYSANTAITEIITAMDQQIVLWKLGHHKIIA